MRSNSTGCIEFIDKADKEHSLGVALTCKIELGTIVVLDEGNPTLLVNLKSLIPFGKKFGTVGFPSSSTTIVPSSILQVSATPGECSLISNIATMDNGTMVEAYKYLNYCQLAKNSLVSKKFRDLIQTHRHRLALLYVDSIHMSSFQSDRAAINVFDKELSPEAYNEWVIRNNYSKQIPIESQVASEESTQSITNGYGLAAYACYKDSSHRGCYDTTSVFSAHVELNHENWPAFQHFVRLATDPFIYIGCVRLTYQNDVLNLLAGAINSDHDRLQCKELNFNLKGNSQKSITWIKNHVRCNKLYIFGKGDLNQDEAFLDFFVTGANCTPSIDISYRDLSKVVTDFVQKFMDLKNSGESQLVEAIKGYFVTRAVELFKRDHARFIVKEDKDDRCATHIFEFVNADIKKKLQLTTVNRGYLGINFSIKINNL
ncbi:hypothetical protein Ddc_22218 [Ditylenchus destructor]|nr:hypothetical protein Ddc_22218 [Ditylenchus destructor]